MTDRVYPAAKPNPPTAALNGTTNGVHPPLNKPPQQLYPPARPRPIYRPNPNHRSSSRSCSCRKFCCLCFLYTLITLLTLLLLTAICACIFYVLYHPKHPSFSVTSARISSFNLTGTDPSGFTHLKSKMDLTITAKNVNKKKITFVYDSLMFSVTSAGVDAGNGTLPAFAHVAGNTTILHATVASDPAKDLDTDSVSQLRSDLGKKNGFPVTVELNTMVEVQMGKFKTKKVGVRVTCDGIKGFQPKNATSKVATPATISTHSKCKVDLRIKIWKFTF